MNSSAQELLFRELKDTISQLNKTIKKQSEEFDAVVTKLQDTINRQKVQIDSLTQELANKQENIDYLLNKVYGKSSEKHKAVDPNQLSVFDFFNEFEKESDPSAPEPTTEEVIVKAHRRKKSTFKEKYKDLPVEKVVHELPEDQRLCPNCGEKLEKVGESFVRNEIVVIPAQVKVIEHYNATYKCLRCEQAKDTGESDLPYFVYAPVPPPLIPKSMASPSIVAMIICMKFVSSLPLYRQEQLWKQEGAALSRPTMANWVIFCSKTYL